MTVEKAVDPGRPSPSDESLSTFDSVILDFRKGLEEAVSRLSKNLEQSVSAPLGRAFLEAAQAHERALAGSEDSGTTAGDEPSPPASEPSERDPWARASEYRASVLTTVLEPLQDTLFSMNSGQSVEAAWASFKADLVRLTAGLPEEIQRPEPPDFLVGRPGDRFRVRLGKSFARMRSWPGDALWGVRRAVAGVLGRGEARRPIRRQQVHVRALAGSCIQGSLALRLEAFREQLHQHYALLLSGLESAVVRWVNDWPLVEAHAEAGAGYLPEDIRGPLAECLSEIPVTESNTSDSVDQAVLPDSGLAGPQVDLDEAAGSLGGAFLVDDRLATTVEIIQRLKTCVDEEWASFLGFLDASGSLFGKFPSAGAKGSAEARTRKMDRRAEHWLRWHRAVPNRLLLAIHRIRLRALLVDAREALVTGVAQHAVIDLVRRWKVTSQAFRGLAEKCDEIFSGPVGDPPGPGLSVEIQGWLDEGIELLEEQWVGPMRSGQFQASVHELADGISTKLASSLADLPDAISVSAPQTVKNGSVDPLIEDRTVTIRASARQVLDVMRLEGIRKLPGPILEVLAGAREGTDALVEVLRFNLEAAMEEVAGSATEDPGTHLEEARSMTREGILRTDEAIPRLLLGLRGGWEGFSRATDDLFSGALEDMDARLSSEGGVQEQIVGVQEKLGHTVRMGTQQIRQTVQQTTRSLRRTARKATIAFLRAIRLGREAVGAAPQEAAQGDRALAVIRLAPTILSDLPLIYRRLFSFEPLTEEVLLKGRTVERAWVQSRFEAWRNGVGGPVILSGPVGAGHTSFFNVLATSLFSEVRTHRVELDRRFRSEESVAASIGQAVGLQEGAVTSFSDLAKALERASSPRRPMVVFTERLEHVFLRTPGGSDLFEDVLSFQAQTSERVFWVSSMSGAAWKLVAKTEPRAASLAHVHPLNPPSRNELEELILARHRRSGLPLEFRPPPDLNPLARRRLRLSHGEKAQQRILQGQYFDRLHRASQESIPMAILHWLRSTDFRSNEGTLFLTPPAEIRYGFLDGLDLDLDFALKAFLEHASLTLEEYREVFAATEDQSFQTFEALRARLLLAPAEAAGAVLPTPGSTVEEGVRYRIPALLSQIVARRLKDRNILH